MSVPSVLTPAVALLVLANAIASIRVVLSTAMDISSKIAFMTTFSDGMVNLLSTIVTPPLTICHSLNL